MEISTQVLETPPSAPPAASPANSESSSPWNSWVKRQNLNSIRKHGKVLFPPFYHKIEGEFVCMQPESLGASSYTEIGEVCKATPFKSFKDFVEHLQDSHCMLNLQEDWICEICEAIFPTPFNFEAHRAHCAVLLQRSAFKVVI